MLTENKTEEAATYMENNNILVIKEAQKELDKLIESGNSTGKQLINDLQEKQRFAIEMLVFLGAASLVISILFGIYISKGISSGIRELEQAARNIAQGKLSSTKINYYSKDEMGCLAEDMRSMVMTLTAVIRDETYLLNEMAEGNFDVSSRAGDSYVGELDSVLSSLE